MYTLSEFGILEDAELVKKLILGSQYLKFTHESFDYRNKCGRTKSSLLTIAVICTSVPIYPRLLGEHLRKKGHNS